MIEAARQTDPAEGRPIIDLEGRKISLDQTERLSAHILAKMLDRGWEFGFDPNTTGPEFERKLDKIMREQKETNEALVERLRGLKEEVYANLESPEAPEYFDGFSEEQLKVIVGNLSSIELTKGCSLACPDCGYSALPGVRETMAFGDLIYLFRNYSQDFSEDHQLMPFYASDPLDWQEAVRDFQDVYELYKFYTDGDIFVSTEYPKGKDDQFVRLLMEGYIGRLSISQQNYKRLIADRVIYEDEKGKIKSVHPFVQDILDHAPDPYGKERMKVGRAFEAEGAEKRYGGIECEMGTILTTDGFKNIVTCIPKEGFENGVISESIDSDRMNQPLDLDNPPKTVQELLTQGIVELQDVHLSSIEIGQRKYDWFVLKKVINGETKRYLVNYDVNSHSVDKIVEDSSGQENEFVALVEVENRRSAIDSLADESNDKIDGLVSYSMFWDIDLRELNKSNSTYQEILDRYRPAIERSWQDVQKVLNTLPKIAGYSKNLFGDRESIAEENRKDFEDLVRMKRNFIELLRDIVGGDEVEVVASSIMVNDQNAAGFYAVSLAKDKDKARQSSKFVREIFEKYSL